MKARKELSAREIDALQESLLRRLGDSSVPTLPHVAVRVLELVSDTNSSFRDFAKAIETDQALTGRLLRMANSPFFGQRNPVTRIERAAMLLGMDRLKALALGFHLSKAATTATDASVKRAWTHALFRACLAARVAENFDSRVSGEAFVVALMADAGRPLMPGLIGDRYPQFIDDNTLPQDQFRAEFESLPFTHVDVAAAMCKLWNLPEVLRKPIIAHHTRPTTFTRSDTPGLLHAVAYFVGSIPTQPPDHKSIASETATQARALFNFKPTEVAAIVEQAAHDLDAYKEFFQHILDETVSLDAIIDTANAYLADQTDDLADESAPHETQTVRKFRTPAFVLEAARVDDSTVRVYIDDPSGQRLTAEEFDPRTRSDNELASALMLDDLDPAEATRVISAIRKLAA
ncbi:MAG: HDOD domain-containing protein [Phycisphaerales bacterium]|nr:HDOD domain-containing protein [Phycisphaerales bacterium]